MADCKKKKCKSPKRPKCPLCIIGGSIKQNQNSDVKVEQPNNNVICSKDTDTIQNSSKKKGKCKDKDKKKDKKRCKPDDKEKRDQEGGDCECGCGDHKPKPPKKKCPPIICKPNKSECKQDNLANQDGTQAQACISNSSGTNVTQDTNNPQAGKQKD